MKYSISKYTIINADKTTILGNVADLTRWNIWSPWNCLDPLSKIDSSQTEMSWQSQFIGTGNMQITSQTNNDVFIELNFVKPFKSHANVVFHIEELSDSQIRVTWEMNSKLPIFLFFFKKLFQVMIGRDFMRGLTRLKYLSETKSVPTKLEFFDIPEQIQQFKIAGISSSCNMNNIPENMHKSFAKLCVLVNHAKVTPIGSVCFCYNIKLSKETMDYQAGVIYNGEDVELGELKSKLIPSHKAIKVVIYGSYDFMGDAWAGIYAHFKGLKLKVNKKVPAYEKYIKGPHNCDNPDEYITEIYMPIKG